MKVLWSLGLLSVFLVIAMENPKSSDSDDLRKVEKALGILLEKLSEYSWECEEREYYKEKTLRCHIVANPKRIVRSSLDDI